jgi:hypothetical protein
MSILLSWLILTLIDSFGWALAGALMMSALGTLGQWLVMRP